MSAAEGTQSRHRKLALSIIWNLNTFDIAAIEKVLSDSPNFNFDFGPRGALSSLGKRGFTKSEVLEFFTRHQTIVKKFEFQQPDFIVEGLNSIAFHTYSKGVAVDDLPFENEYSWFIEFDDDDKIIRVTETVDSAYIRDVTKRVGYEHKWKQDT